MTTRPPDIVLSITDQQHHETIAASRVSPSMPEDGRLLHPPSKPRPDAWSVLDRKGSSSSI